MVVIVILLNRHESIEILNVSLQTLDIYRKHRGLRAYKLGKGRGEYFFYEKDLREFVKPSKPSPKRFEIDKTEVLRMLETMTRKEVASRLGCSVGLIDDRKRKWKADAKIN